MATKRLILKVLRENGPLSRADIARALGITLPRACTLVASLEKAGAICKTGEVVTTGGRPAPLIEYNWKRAFVAGFDIDGESITSGIGDLNGKVIRSKKLSFGCNSVDQLIDRIIAEVNELLSEIGVSPAKLKAVSIGITSAVDSKTGLIQNMPTTGWQGFHLKDPLAEHFGKPVYIENDANMAALGEKWSGAGRDIDNMVYVNIRSGVSAGIVIDGHIYNGTRGCAGEIGYLPIGMTDNHPPFDVWGCLEQSCSEKAIEARVLEALGPEDCPRGIEEIYAEYRRNNVRIREAMSPAIQNIALALASIAAILDPAIFVIGGPIVSCGDDLLKELTHAATSVVPWTPEIRFSSLGEKAVMIGAIRHALINESDKENDELLRFQGGG